MKCLTQLYILTHELKNCIQLREIFITLLFPINSKFQVTLFDFLL